MPRIHGSLVALFLLSAWMPTPSAGAQGQKSHGEEFLARAYHSPAGETMPYRLFVPRDYNPAKKYPLVLWLHNAAGRGSDNLLQISGSNFLGTHIWTDPENQEKHPAFVLAPQCGDTKAWGRPHANTPPVALRLALEILDKVEREYSVDLDRVYVVGQSMGGEGVWAALADAPGRFAAAIALCGYGELWMIDRDAKVPVWIFQGDADEIVDVGRAREWVEALHKADGAPKYTEVPAWGHNVWEKAFTSPDIVPWIFAQHR
jgi:predicted peptidase